jgi:hypothetical protein
MSHTLIAKMQPVFIKLISYAWYYCDVLCSKHAKELYFLFLYYNVDLFLSLKVGLVVNFFCKIEKNTIFHVFLVLRHTAFLKIAQPYKIFGDAEFFFPKW